MEALQLLHLALPCDSLGAAGADLEYQTSAKASRLSASV